MAGSILRPGFRFHPTDEELLVHYLKPKVSGKFEHESVVGEIDFYSHEPAELPGLAALRRRDSEWFFFNRPGKKQLRGCRTNRTTGAGYWKATGKDREIVVGSCVGLKKTLIYYQGRAPHGERTDWVMHEYRLADEAKNSSDSVVLCRVRRKSGLGPRNGDQFGAPVLEVDEIERSSDSFEDRLDFSPSVSLKPSDEQIFKDLPTIVPALDLRLDDQQVDPFLNRDRTCQDPQLLAEEESILRAANDETDLAVEQPSPSTSARVVADLLGMTKPSPASAAEPPLGWEHRILRRDSREPCATESKAQQLLALVKAARGHFSVSSYTLRVALTIPRKRKKEVQRISEAEPQWLVSSTSNLEGYHRRFWKCFKNATSVFAFCITALALVLFSMLRGFCRPIFKTCRVMWLIFLPIVANRQFVKTFFCHS